MRAESLLAQINAVRQRLAVLQRRAEHPSSATALLQKTLGELEHTVAHLGATQEELLSHHEQLAAVREELEQERRRYWDFFDAVPDAYLVTSPDADILEANRAAAALLNISQRFLIGKNLSLFVSTDRARVIAQARRLAELGGRADWVLTLRPRERSPLEVTCRVLASGSDRTLRWLISRTASPDSVPRR